MALIMRDQSLLSRCAIGLFFATLCAVSNIVYADVVYEQLGTYYEFRPAQNAQLAASEGGHRVDYESHGGVTTWTITFHYVLDGGELDARYGVITLYDSGECPSSKEPDGNGECIEPEDDATGCPAEGEKRTVLVSDITSAQKDVLNSSGVRDENGCGYSSGGVDACFPGDKPGTVSCALGFASDHKIVPSGGDQLDYDSSNFAEGTNGDQEYTPPEGGGESTSPAESTHDVEAPQVTRNSDGSETTVERDVTTATSAGTAQVRGPNDNGQYRGTIVEPSTSTTTVVKTTDSRADGGTKVTDQETVKWVNGDTYTFATTPSGGVSVSRTPGTSGGGTTSTTTTTNPDGSSTSMTTHDGDDGEGADCSGESCSVDGSTTGDGDALGDNSGEASSGGSGGGDGEGNGDVSLFGGPCKEGDQEVGGKLGSEFDDGSDDQSDAEDKDQAGSGYGCAPTLAKSLDTLLTGVKESPLYSEIDQIPEQVPAGSGTCPVTSFDVFGETYEFSPGCDLLEDNRSVIASAAKAAWALLAIVFLLGV
ncbi:hypothetical protein V5738_08850 [Salinisphaera sp. SPP-AMP-43]|uniref:hypothetical protein n=1 Tax=Salinisphaera sp. SPP-AMP-43 TaxID=3121288 RepID=UPI003C6DFE2B